MKTSRALKASRSLREGFAKASRRLQPYPRRLLEGFAKAPRAPPFGNDSSDNDKPPYFYVSLPSKHGSCYYDRDVKLPQQNDERMFTVARRPSGLVGNHVVHLLGRLMKTIICILASVAKSVRM